MEAIPITLTVNGEKRSLKSDAKRPLLDLLREDCALSGAKYGCGEGECGACSVLIDGKRVFSCITTAGEANGKSITTIEGLAHGDQLHPVQQAFLDENAFQCGYCTSGMILATVALLSETPNPNDEQLVKGMQGNVCRCCAYQNIRAAVRRAATLTSNKAAQAIK
jgi:aerobic-type carbon monoxide dehydrogenase small subunit (CoxS/CutS family)